MLYTENIHEKFIKISIGILYFKLILRKAQTTPTFIECNDNVSKEKTRLLSMVYFSDSLVRWRHQNHMHESFFS